MIPGLLTSTAYLVGILLGVRGVIMLKEHVEAPTKTPLPHAAITFVAGGALFALPILFEAMFVTIDDVSGSPGVDAALVNEAEFNVN